MWVSAEQKANSIKALNDGLREIYKDSSICGNFGTALRWMKDGKMVRRMCWVRGSCIFLIKGRTVEYNTLQKFKNNACQAFNPPRDVEIEDHIDGKIEGKYITGVTLTQADLLAEDWEVINV